MKILRLWVGNQVRGLKIRINQMLRRDIERMIIGSIKEIIQDRQYFYHSTAGPEYCHLTEEGNRAIIDLVNVLGSRLLKAEAEEDIERSKQLVLDQLKGK